MDKIYTADKAAPTHAKAVNAKPWNFIKDNLEKTAYVAFYFIALVLSALWVYFSLGIISITDDEGTKKIVTTYKESDKILALANVEVLPQDKVLCTTYDNNFQNINILRGFDLIITRDGGTSTKHMVQGRVKDVLEESGVRLDDNDFTTPSLSTVLKKGDSVRVYRVEYVDNQYREKVPHKTDYKYSSLLFKRQKKTYTLREGSDGVNLVTYRERYVDGEKVLALVSKIEVEKEPINSLVLAYGNEPVSPLPAPGGVTVSGGVPSGYSRVISNVRATGYYSPRGRGSSGLGLFYGSVAVNPNIIPYGSKMYITSTDGRFVYGWAVATDTGTALMNGIIGVDLFYETYLESCLNGKIPVNIYVY
jgi:3D (Asp-Asp-Asp) domain-containing protein